MDISTIFDFDKNSIDNNINDKDKNNNIHLNKNINLLNNFIIKKKIY